MAGCLLMQISYFGNFQLNYPVVPIKSHLKVGSMVFVFTVHRLIGTYNTFNFIIEMPSLFTLNC